MKPDTKLLILVMLGSTILCVCGSNEVNVGVHKRRRIERQATSSIWDRLSTPFPTWNPPTTRRWSTWEPRTYTPRPSSIWSAWTYTTRRWSTWEPRTYTPWPWSIWSAYTTRSWSSWSNWGDSWASWTSDSYSSVSSVIIGIAVGVPVVIIVIVVAIVVAVVICNQRRARNRPRAMYPLANQPVAVPPPVNTAQLPPGAYPQQMVASPYPVTTYPQQYTAPQPMVQNQGEHAYDELNQQPSNDKPPAYNEATNVSVYPPATPQPVTGGPGYVTAAPTGYNNPSYADSNVTNTGGTVGNSGTTTTVDNSGTAMD